MKQIFGVTVTLLLGLGLLFTSNKSPEIILEGYKIGDVVDDFTLKNTSGEQVSLSGYLAKDNIDGVIVIFTCNTCPYAVAYEDRIIELHETYTPKGHPVMAINPNDPAIKPGDSFDKMQVRAEKKGFPYDYAFDETQEVVNKFGATKTPHVFLIDAEMRVRYIGAIDNNATDPSGVTSRYVEDAIEAIDSGKDPDPTVTKAVGCSIKFKRGT